MKIIETPSGYDFTFDGGRYGPYATRLKAFNAYKTELNRDAVDFIRQPKPQTKTPITGE